MITWIYLLLGIATFAFLLLLISWIERLEQWH